MVYIYLQDTDGIIFNNVDFDVLLMYVVCMTSDIVLTTQPEMIIIIIQKCRRLNSPTRAKYFQ